MFAKSEHIWQNDRKKCTFLFTTYVNHAILLLLYIQTANNSIARAIINSIEVIYVFVAYEIAHRQSKALLEEDKENVNVKVFLTDNAKIKLDNCCD